MSNNFPWIFFLFNCCLVSVPSFTSKLLKRAVLTLLLVSQSFGYGLAFTFVSLMKLSLLIEESANQMVVLVSFLLDLFCGHSLNLDTPFPSLTSKVPSLAFLFLASLAIFLSLLCKHFLFLCPPERLPFSRALGLWLNTLSASEGTCFQVSTIVYVLVTSNCHVLSSGTCTRALGSCCLRLHLQRHHWSELLEQSPKGFLPPVSPYPSWSEQRWNSHPHGALLFPSTTLSLFSQKQI